MLPRNFGKFYEFWSSCVPDPGHADAAYAFSMAWSFDYSL